MILIADGGSTNTSWVGISSDGLIQVSFTTEGYNPYYVSVDYIVKSLGESFPKDVYPSEVVEVHFYGAGCSDDMFLKMKDAFRRIFRNAQIYIAMDLLAAARSLLSDKPGFAAILGTGTNTCLYDGEKITMNIDSLGFMLGDEGSGAYIGRLLLADFMRGQQTKGIQMLLRKEYSLTNETILNRVYSHEYPNRYCAGFCRFINENMDLYPDYFHALVKKAFRNFFTNIVCLYPDYKTYSFNCVGSIGYYFRDILVPVCEEFGMVAGQIIQSPIEGLIAYHSDKRGVSI